MKNVLELKQTRQEIRQKALDLLDTIEKENRSMTTEDQTQYDRISADVDALTREIDAIEAVQRQQREAGEREAQLREQAGNGGAGGSGDAGEQRGANPATSREEYREAFRSYLANGINNISPEHRDILKREEARALAAQTGTAGGFTVAQGFYATMTDALKFFGGMRQVATTLRTANGAALPMPTANDTGNLGALIAENAVMSSTPDLAFAQKTLNAYKFTSNILLVSMELLQDSAFDIETWIATKLGERVGRIQNQLFTIGTGTSQPQGVVVGASSGKVGTVGQTTSVIFDDLVDLQHSVDAAYRQKARYMMHDLTMKAMKKMKDGQNRPLWLPGIAEREPDTINGFPYTINNDMAQMAVSAKSILFGDFSQYFIRDVMDVQVVRLAERYAEYGQVGFVALARADGGLLDAGMGPIRFYQNSAT